MKLKLYRLLSWLGIYKLYEKWLNYQIKNGKMPKHIGVILDGNRRWAIEHGYMKWYGHKIGARKLRNLIKWAKEFNIKYLTVFAFSTENFKRGEEEMKWFSNLLREELESALEDDDLSRHSIKIKFIGDISKFPTEIQEKAKLLEERTKNNSSLEVNIALGYGGKWDIINATRKIVKDVLKGRLSINDITYDTFQNYLATSHMTHQDVDLILRTGGEMRLSNFLLWQAAYSELVFLDVYWPEFRKIDFMRAIRTYQQRNRRFGR